LPSTVPWSLHWPAMAQLSILAITASGMQWILSCQIFYPNRLSVLYSNILSIMHRLSKEWYDSHQHWRLWTFQSRQAPHTTSKAWIFRAHQNTEGYILPVLRLRRENPRCFWIHSRMPIISTITLYTFSCELDLGMHLTCVPFDTGILLVPSVPSGLGIVKIVSSRAALIMTWPAASLPSYFTMRYWCLSYSRNSLNDSKKTAVTLFNLLKSLHN